MTDRSFRRLLMAMVLYAPAAFSALFATTVSDLTAEVAAARAEYKQLAVMFQLADCVPCQQMKRTILRDAATEAEFSHCFRTVSVSLDSEAALTDPAGNLTTAQAFAGRLHIVATPAFAFFDGDGHVLYRYVGVLTEPADVRLLGRYVSEAAYEQQPFAAYRQQHMNCVRHCIASTACDE